MKTIIILHGTGETQNSFWYPWLKNEIEKIGYKFVLPQLPNSNTPKLEEQLEFCLENLELNENTNIITHSSGTPLALALLERSSSTIEKLISVAGYCSPITINPKDSKNLQENYDWEKIKSKCKEFIFINSDNDPWGANDVQGKKMHEKLGGKLIINHEGHMGSESFNQPYKKFPLLLTLLNKARNH